MLHPITQASVTQVVVDQIVQLIKQTPLRQGDKLPSEKELLEALNVSRPTVREALRALSAMGLVESRRGQGTFVRQVRAGAAFRPEVLSILLAKEDVQEIQYARRLIESDVAALFVQRATPEDYEAVEETLSRMEQALDAGESIYEHTWEFHWELARIAGNSVLAKLLEVLYGMIRELQITYYEPFIDPRQEVLSHRTFLEQMRSATPEEARLLIREHLNQVNTIMLQAMQRSDLNMESV